MSWYHRLGFPRSARYKIQTKNSNIICERQKELLDAIAHRLIGVKYKFGAEVSKDTLIYKVTEIDCSEFTEYIFSKIDIIIPDGSWNQHASSYWISPDYSDCGDLAFKRNNGRISHVALVVFDGYVIEADGWMGKVRKRTLKSFMNPPATAKNKFDSVRRLKFV